MKKYTFELVIHEGSDEWWEGLDKENKTGCDELTALLADLLFQNGFHVNVHDSGDDSLILKHYEG